MKWQKIASLQTVYKSAKKGSDTAVILHHGYGADANDLAPLNSYLDPKQKWDWYFPQAPLQVMIAPGMTGYAWFPIDMAALEQAMMTGQHRDFSSIRPQGFDDACEMALDFYEVLAENYDNLIIGGFSQGAMVSLEVSLTQSRKDQLKALVLLSGALIDRETTLNQARLSNATPFFQSHGQQDAMLSFKDAKRLHQLLKEAGHKGEWHEFSGGHEIPMPVLEKLEGFLNNSL